MRSLKKILWFMVAVIFLIESWLWNKMTALISRLVAIIPLETAKKLVISKVESLSPWPTLGVFIIPVILLEPFKIVGLWLLAKSYIITGILVFLAAKIVGLGVIAFLFEACKPKLLQLNFIAWGYDKIMIAKVWAKKQVAPALQYIQAYKANIRVIWLKYAPIQGAIRNKILRRVIWLRRKIRSDRV